VTDTEQTEIEPISKRLQQAMRDCPDSVVWHARVSPADTFAGLARACEELGLDDWDTYGGGGPVERLEKEVAELLGKPAAVFFISGTMAQQAALRVWCERRGSTRVAIPGLAHQLHHENDGPRLLQAFRFELLTDERRPATADDLTAIAGHAGLGAVQLELPLREAGCLLPTWEELTAFSATAHELGVPLHVDGARIWESQPWFDRPLAEIAALFDSMYVSFYKGLGGLSGAAVVADEDVAAELRGWRQRMGGQLWRMTPYAVSALVGLRDRLPEMGEYVAWARTFAGELVTRGFRVTPDPPHTNTFQAFADADPDAISERVLAFVETEQLVPSGGWWAARTPGVAMTEVAIHSAALRHDPAKVADWWASFITPVGG
jgi:threonine aldolase